MTAAATSVPASAVPLKGAAILEALRAAGIEFVVSVPDIVTSEGLLRPLASRQDMRLVRVCKEDEGISICAALSFCGKRALLLMQHTGLLDSLNALRAIGVEYANPVCMMVGLLGAEAGIAPQRSARYGVRIVPAILDAMGVPHWPIGSDADLPLLERGIAHAYASGSPAAFLLGISPA